MRLLVSTTALLAACTVNGMVIPNDPTQNTTIPDGKIHPSSLNITRRNYIKIDVTNPITSVHDIITAIVGGTRSGIKPWMVSIGQWYKHGGKTLYWHYCGGALIAPQYVLTAAHCADPSSVGDTVLMGGTDLRQMTTFQKFTIVSQTIHPQYDSVNIVNDLAILKLNAPANGRTPISLNTAAQNDLPGKTATVSGWGVTSEGAADVSPVLLQVNLPINNVAKCDDIYSPVYPAKQLCAGGQKGKDSCQGDSGGPVFVMAGATAIHIGIVSYGDGCARANVPGVYTRTSAYVSWIQKLRIPIRVHGVSVRDATVTWLANKRCGKGFPLRDGTPAECNPDKTQKAYCCSPSGYCGSTAYHCTAPGINYGA